LDGCWSDYTVWYTGGGYSGNVLHQGYDGSRVFCYTTGDGDGQSDAYGSDYESWRVVFTFNGGPDGGGGDGGLDGWSDLYVLDGCRGDECVLIADGGHSGHVLHQGYDGSGLL
jgi:hypothetical protein